MMKSINSGDCNGCVNYSCKGADHIETMNKCQFFRPPQSGFSLAEMALQHPQSLHDALSSLPFMVNLRGVTRLLK